MRKLPVTLKVTLTVLTIFIFMVFDGCVMPNDESKEKETLEWGDVEADSFLEKRTITVRWRGDRNAEEYILMRARDEITGAGLFEEVYRGKGLRYTDRTVEDDIRYIYRVDFLSNGNVYEGEKTGIGVGSNADIDINEPNNRREQATALNTFKRAAMHYFRFSDGRELTDTDWYKVRVGGGKTVYILVREEGITGITRLLIALDGKEAFEAEHGKWYEIKNDASVEKEFYIEITANTVRYVEPGLAGGTVRGYTVIRSDSMEDEFEPEPGDGTVTKPGDDDGNGTDPDDPDDPDDPEDPEDPDDPDDPIVIEERSDLFEPDGTGWSVFFLNETEYMGENYTFWKGLNDWNRGAGMTVSMIKDSGNSLGGYGFFFAGGEVEGYGECMLVLLLRTGGYYTVGKVIEGSYSEIIPWTRTARLSTGYGTINTAGIRWNGVNSEYVLTLNSGEERRFVDRQAPVCTGTRAGVVAVVTAAERFPQTPVKVWYR